MYCDISSVSGWIFSGLRRISIVLLKVEHDDDNVLLLLLD